MEESAKEKIQRIAAPVWYLISILGVVFNGCIQNKDLPDILSGAVLSIVLAGIFRLVLKTKKWNLWKQASNPILLFGSGCLTWIAMAGNDMYFGPLCFIFVMQAALDAGLPLGITVYVYVILQRFILQLPVQLIAYKEFVPVVFGLLLVILFSMVKNKKVMPYVTVILLACDGVLQFVQYEFQINQIGTNGKEVLMEFAGVILLCLTAYAYLHFFRQTEMPLKEKKTTIETILEPEFALRVRLLQYSPQLMQHSEKIAALSEGAVIAAGGDGMLAKAAGLYHEVGRIQSETDYIEAGTKLAEEYDFPEEVIVVMRQHSTGYELPQSLEAAVVMLSDCIVSTSDYLQKAGKRTAISDEKLVNSIFQNRIQKGNLKESKMTEEQMERLKAYYIGHAFAKEQ